MYSILWYLISGILYFYAQNWVYSIHSRLIWVVVVVFLNSFYTIFSIIFGVFIYFTYFECFGISLPPGRSSLMNVCLSVSIETELWPLRSLNGELLVANPALNFRKRRWDLIN